MAVANFEELCKGLCEVTGTALPALNPDETGRVAMVLELQGIKFILAHQPHEAPATALLLAVFGPLPQGREVPACRALLALNCTVHTLGFAFARHPASGDIVLKHLLALDACTAVDLFQRITQMAEGIEGWREHSFLAEEAQS
jgi:hypothetical protein